MFTSRDERLMVGAQEKQLIVEANRVDESSPKETVLGDINRRLTRCLRHLVVKVLMHQYK